jgi:hypothetical protein
MVPSVVLGASRTTSWRIVVDEFACRAAASTTGKAPSRPPFASCARSSVSRAPPGRARCTGGLPLPLRLHDHPGGGLGRHRSAAGAQPGRSRGRAPDSLRDLDVPPRFVRIPESDRPVIQLPLLGDAPPCPWRNPNSSPPGSSTSPSDTEQTHQNEQFAALSGKEFSSGGPLRRRRTVPSRLLAEAVANSSSRARTRISTSLGEPEEKSARLVRLLRRSGLSQMD